MTSQAFPSPLKSQTLTLMPILLIDTIPGSEGDRELREILAAALGSIQTTSKRRLPLQIPDAEPFSLEPIHLQSGRQRNPQSSREHQPPQSCSA
jgi:hypothetical protein